MTITQKLLLSLIILLTFLFRFYQVSEIPHGLYHDEVDAGYQARSLLQTGKDYRGDLSPFFISSFVDPRTPIPVYLTAITTILFNTPELQVRMSSVIVGTINVLLIFILVRLWFKNFYLASVVAFVFATNPWHIQFSRFNHEAQSIILMLLLFLICFTLGLLKKKFILLVLAVMFLALGMYTYRTMSLFSPLILVISYLIFREKLKFLNVKKTLALLALFLTISLPFVSSTTFFASDRPRISQISIFSAPEIPIQVQRDRELDSGDATDFSIGKQAVPYSFVIHNKLEHFFEDFFINYLSTFNVDFLFIHGDKNHRHSIENSGMLLYIDILALGFGLFWLFKNRKLEVNKLILGLFFLSPIPSSITQDGAAHGARLFIFTLPLLVTIGIGYYQIILYIKELRFRYILFGCLGVAWLIIFSFYLHNYFTHFYYTSARWHGDGYKKAIQKIIQIENKYKRIELVGTKDPPIIHYLFWSNTPPQLVQEYGTEFSKEIHKDQLLDKIKVAQLPKGSTQDLISAMEQDSLYLVTQEELRVDLRNQPPPPQIKLIEIITYPDKEIAFYLISKNTHLPNPM